MAIIQRLDLSRDGWNIVVMSHGSYAHLGTGHLAIIATSRVPKVVLGMGDASAQPLVRVINARQVRIAVTCSVLMMDTASSTPPVQKIIRWKLRR